MKKNPLVSVIMPVYNTEQYVEQAIKSILRQTFTDFEFIIVDDCSSDRTPEIIRSFNDARIIFIQLESNQGVIKAFERGIHKARGNWIMRMDADDISFPKRLSVQLDFLNNHKDVVLIGTTFYLISPAGRVLRNKNEVESGWHVVTKEDLSMERRKFADPSVVFSRQAALDVGLFDDDVDIEQPLWYKLMSAGKVVELYNPLYLYRIVLSSITKKRRKESRREIYNKVLLRYDPINAPKHRSWDASTFPSEKHLRTSSIIQAMRMCLVTRDRKAAWRIFKEICAEFGLTPFLLYIFLKGVVGVKSLNPFSSHGQMLEEIKLEWYEEKYALMQ